jgi:diaminohydroxyphosphoribosylaminopyrimidine deaminase/5-amino-6-(5-phosphoribosylamino)uracil reductase
MQRAIELSSLGLGYAAPNPLVGCVIVYDDKIIGEGWHRQFGEAHAEINALKSVQDKSLLRDATLFVTLEPCAHYGKTPPCSLEIVRSGIRKVVVATSDPFPKVAGKGLQQLRDAGIEVKEGLLAEKARFVNRRFLINQLENRPYIILKWAQSADGFMDAARETNQLGSIRISGDAPRRLTHRWRSEEAGILVGVRTVMVDNPLLTCRYWEGRNPIRIVLDRNEMLSGQESIFNEDAPTIHCTSNWLEAGKAEMASDEFTSNVIPKLYEQGISSILVEGGQRTLKQFLQSGMWDELRIFTSQNKFENGLKAPQPPKTPEQRIQLESDVLEVYYRKSNF